MAPSKTEELGGELRMFQLEERANWLVSRAVKQMTSRLEDGLVEVLRVLANRSMVAAIRRCYQLLRNKSVATNCYGQVE